MEDRNETLFGLSRAMQDVIEGGYSFDPDTGEIFWSADDIEALNVRIADKAMAVSNYQRMKLADAKAAREQAKRLGDWAKALERQAESLDGYLCRCVEMNGGAIETAQGRISIRHSKAIDIIDPDSIPDGYMVEKVERRPDKRAIKEAIQGGGYVPGAALVENRKAVCR